jgi:hypothetical protein
MFFTATQGAKIRTPVRLTNRERYSKQLTLRLLESTDTQCRYSLEIVGGLTSSDPPLDIDLEIQYQRTALMSNAAAQAAYANDVFKYEYFCFDVEFPVSELELEIAFATTVSVAIFPAVFFGWSEFSHDAELRRTHSGFTKTPNGARFIIKEPLVGFRYLLHWSFTVPHA